MFVGGIAEADVREQTFRWTTANPVGHPIPMGGHKLAELVAQKSSGKLQVKLSGGKLVADVEDLRQVWATALPRALGL